MERVFLEKLMIFVCLFVFSTQVQAATTSPTSCSPSVGDSGPASTAILKRTWCQQYTKKICFTVSYPLKKGVLIRTSQANKTVGVDVSAKFYGKEVCIAFMYKRYKWSYSYNRYELDSSYCRRTCFSGYKFNLKEVRQESADWYGTALERESDYQLIVQRPGGHEGNGQATNSSRLLLLLSCFLLALICSS